jgi:hypothetical protein
MKMDLVEQIRLSFKEIEDAEPFLRPWVAICKMFDFDDPAMVSAFGKVAHSIFAPKGKEG